MFKKPNILFIMTDDQASWALHCSGNYDIYTPNIDSLASNGVRFENFFCGSPVCSPARACIVTGEIPSTHGIHDWLSGGNINTQKYPYMSQHEHFKNIDHGIEYLEGHPSYIQELSKIGYNCALSGKWHLGNNDHAKKGFSKWFTISSGGCNYFCADTFENGKFKQEDRYITDVITEKAITYMNELNEEENPFYLSVHYTAPHSPWTAQNHPKELLEIYDDCDFTFTPRTKINKDQINSCPVGDTEEHWRENLTGYYAAITGVDRGVGKIKEHLEKLGILDDTIIIFTSDNGMNLGQHGIWGKGNGTYPPNMYDSSIKVPLIISGPTIQQGKVETALVSACDIFPTIMDLCGNSSYKKTKKQCGKSFVSLLKYSLFDKSGDIIITDEYGLVRMIRTKSRKYIYCTDSEHSAFYNLETDPNETINEIDNVEYQEEIDDMADKLNVFFSKYSIRKNNGLRLKVTGKGQKDFCYKDNAFENDFHFYWDKHKDTK